MCFIGVGAAEVSLLMCAVILMMKRQLLSFVKVTVFLCAYKTRTAHVADGSIGAILIEPSPALCCCQKIVAKFLDKLKSILYIIYKWATALICMLASSDVSRSL